MANFTTNARLLAELSSGSEKSLKDKPVIPMDDYPNVSRLSTGSRRLNYALGGGIPCGETSIFWGAEGSGKSTAGYLTIAETQRQYPGAVFAVVITEGFDESWPRKLGVDMSRIALFFPETIEEAFDIIHRLLLKNTVWGILFDSIGMIENAGSIDEPAGQRKVSGNAPIIADFFKRNTKLLFQAKRLDVVTGERINIAPALMITNHVTEKIGVMYGDPETMNGGRRLRHSAACWLRFKDQGTGKNTIMNEDEVVAVIHEGYVKKNKFGKPFRKFKFTVRQDEANYGVDSVLEVADLALKFGLITNREGNPWKNGTTFYQGVEVPIGTRAVPKARETEKTLFRLEELLRESDEWYDKLEAAVDTCIVNRTDAAPSAEAENVNDPNDDEFNGLMDLGE